ncbi:MAG: hypothetical protein FWD61_14325 [Phycisphaerales bacterium]|nr:hypothetical protein [Phycisphaerales bacterium]
MSDAPRLIKILPIDQLKGLPLGRVLIKMGCLTHEQVLHGLDVQREQRAKGVQMPVGEILVEQGLVSETVCNLALAAQMGNERMYKLAVSDLESANIPLVREYPPQ